MALDPTLVAGRPGASALDEMPPSPDLNPNRGMPGMAGMAPPLMGSQQIPPEILTGILARASQMAKDFDAFAQVTPDLAGEWGMLRDFLERITSKLLVAGAGPTTPTSPGATFPGGGLDSGPPV